MTDVAAFPNVNITAFEPERRIGFQAGDRLGQRILEKQRDDLHQAADRDHEDHQNDHQADIFFDFVVC